MANPVIGLDLGQTSIRAIEISDAEKRRFTVERYGRVDLPDGAVRDGVVADPHAVGSALRRLWAEARFSSKLVALGVGGKRVLVRDLVLPETPLDAIREVLPNHVQDNLPVPVSEAVLDFYPIREVNNQQGRAYQGLLVAVLKDAVKANMDAVKIAGLRAVSVDLNAFALARAGARGEFSKQTTALVDIGANATTIVITAGAVPQYVRTLPSGSAAISEAISERLKVSYIEAERLKISVGVGGGSRPDQAAVAEAVLSVVQPLTVNLRDTLSYYNQQHPQDPLRAVVLGGAGGQLAGFKEALSDAFRIPVTLADPLTEASISRRADQALLHGDRHALLNAIGLAGGK